MIIHCNICCKICFNFNFRCLCSSNVQFIRIGRSYLLIHEIKILRGVSFSRHRSCRGLLLPRAQEVSPCTSRSFIEHPVFFTRNSLRFVSRSILRGKPIPRLIGLTESRNNLKSGRPEVLFGNFQSSSKLPLIFQRVWKRNFPAKGELCFAREKERRIVPLIRKTSESRSQLSQFSLLNQLLCKENVFF